MKRRALSIEPRLEPEAEKRKQEFLLLDAVAKRHDFGALVEMNGARCAGAQIFDLRVYDRPQRPITQQQEAA